MVSASGGGWQGQDGSCSRSDLNSGEQTPYIFRIAHN